jgi:hypothetical protein
LQHVAINTTTTLQLNKGLIIEYFIKQKRTTAKIK